MKKTTLKLVLAAATVAALSLAGLTLAGAASKVMHKGPKPPPPPPPESQPAAAPAPTPQPAPPSDTLRCQRIKDALNMEQRKVQDLRADKVRYDAEYAAIQARLKELDGLRAAADKDIKTLEQRLKYTQSAFDKKCANALNCETYERYVDALEDRLKPIEAELAAVEQGIGATTTEMTELEKAIPPVQAEYSKLGCAKLEPGETAQETIDRCYALMSDWNRLQRRLNDQRDRLPQLQARYADLSQRLAGMQAPLDEYNAFLEKSCSSSAKVAKVRDMRVRKDKYQGLGNNITTAIERLNKLKGVKITVEGK